jgi:hypothetical protein
MIDEEPALLRSLHLLSAEIENIRVGSRVPDEAADVSLDNAYGDHAKTSIELGCPLEPEVNSRPARQQSLDGATSTV